MNTLQIAADSPWLIKAGAAALLFLHIGGGVFGMISGVAAVAVRKGGRAHAVAGTIFFAAMMAMASVGAIVAPFLLTAKGSPKLFDSGAGFFTCYLVVTGWMTVRRKAGTIGRAEVAAFAFAALLAAGILALGARTAGNAGGYFALGGLVALAAALDLKVILNRGITGKSRLARHLWRMCLALFVALGSFFLGQQRVMPELLRGSPLLFIPPLIPIAAMLYWLVRVRFAKAVGRVALRAAPLTA